MAGTIEVPDDFDRMAASEIERLFDGGACCIAASLRDSPAVETAGVEAKLNAPPSVSC